jgi:hypothetical protein
VVIVVALAERPAEPQHGFPMGFIDPRPRRRSGRLCRDQNVTSYDGSAFGVLSGNMYVIQECGH